MCFYREIDLAKEGEIFYNIVKRLKEGHIIMDFLSKKEILMATHLNKSKAHFRDIVKAVTGYEIMEYDGSDINHKSARHILEEACDRVLNSTISLQKSVRVNEASNDIHRRLVKELKKIVGYDNVESHQAGYPDVVFTPTIVGRIPCHVEVKATGKDEPEKENLRGFYASGNLRNIQSAGLHFSVAFKLVPIKVLSSQFKLFNLRDEYNGYSIRNRHIMDLYNFDVDLKCEWNAPTKKLYGVEETCEKTMF